MSLSIAPQSNTSDSLLTLRDAYPIPPRSPQSWSGESPRTLTTEDQSKMQRFLGFANFYRRSIQGYSKNFAHGFTSLPTFIKWDFWYVLQSDVGRRAVEFRQPPRCASRGAAVYSGSWHRVIQARNAREIPTNQTKSWRGSNPQSPGKYPSSI